MLEETVQSNVWPRSAENRETRPVDGVVVSPHHVMDLWWSTLEPRHAQLERAGSAAKIFACLGLSKA